MPGTVVGLDTDTVVMSAPARPKQPCKFVTAGLGGAALVLMVLIVVTLSAWLDQGGLSGAVGQGLVIRLGLLVVGLGILLYIRQRVKRACAAEDH